MRVLSSRRWGLVALVLALFSMSLEAAAIEPQRAQNWCWASAVQELLSEVGMYDSQEDIAARLDGWPRNRPAYSVELVGLLRSYGIPAYATGRPGTPQELFATLNSGHRIIALVYPGGGVVGHYVVLEAARMDGTVVVADPASGMTMPVPLQMVYLWRWLDAVVAG